MDSPATRFHKHCNAAPDCSRAVQPRMSSLCYVILLFLNALCAIAGILAPSEASAATEVPYTLEDRDRLTRIEARLDGIDKRFEQIDKRFDQIDKRFDQIDKRFDQTDKRFGDILSFMWMLTVVFTGVTCAAITFALWDRRTMIRPFEVRSHELEKLIGAQGSRVDTLIGALKELAQTDGKLAAVLRAHSIQ